MTRKLFLGLFGIGAAGQTTATIGRVTHQSPRHPGVRFTARGECTTSGNGLTRGCAVEAGITTDKPANGECPVCGTMAEPYKRSMAPSQFNRNCRPIGDWGMECDKASYVPNGPSTRTVSCAHCRVRFDQDAEEAK